MTGNPTAVLPLPRRTSSYCREAASQLRALFCGAQRDRDAPAKVQVTRGEKNPNPVFIRSLLSSPLAKNPDSSPFGAR